HRGQNLYAISENMRVATRLDTSALSYTDEEGETVHGLPEVGGSFVLHNGLLYYKTRGIYAVITQEGEGLRVGAVAPFRPTLLLNADPAVPGAGDLYQPLNRLSHSFYVSYSPQADGTTDFCAPFFGCDIVQVETLNGQGEWVVLEYSPDTNYTRQIRKVRVKDGSAIQAGRNNVRIHFSRRSTEEFKTQYQQLMSCNIAAVYGGGEGLCMVLAGCQDRPNGYFWSANTDVSMDPTYFPTEHYNLAGDFSDPITALGRQQNKLVIFQKNRIGGAVFGTEEIDGRTFITMHYATIHPSVGCDLPDSVQLIENNLVFANRDRGIFLLRDTTAAGENTIAHLSRNIECGTEASGLLQDLRQDGAVISRDDGERYWLMVGGHAWLWDYRLGGSIGTPGSLSWFYFDGLQPSACMLNADTAIGTDGIVRPFTDGAAADFETVVALPIRSFGTYEVRKDISKVIFALDGGDGEVAVEYVTDHETRTDRTPLVCGADSDRPFAQVFVRKPRCLGVRHFLCRLRTQGRMAFASAQVVYRYKGEER
ncbi:MAG: hypothetical protein IKU95_00545, partial [Clostridia bacterium]|nr:hypothetical protein [Clostridia bacterium]